MTATPKVAVLDNISLAPSDANIRVSSLMTTGSRLQVTFTKDRRLETPL